MGKVKSSQADPTHDGGDVDVYEVDVSTGTGGAGSTTKSWAENFDGTPTVIPSVIDDAGDAYVSARGSSQCTVEVTGATASSTVTVGLWVVGDR